MATAALDGSLLLLPGGCSDTAWYVCARVCCMQVNEFVKRVRAFRIHLLIIGHIKKVMGASTAVARLMQSGVVPPARQDDCCVCWCVWCSLTSAECCCARDCQQCVLVGCAVSWQHPLPSRLCPCLARPRPHARCCSSCQRSSDRWEGGLLPGWREPGVPLVLVNWQSSKEDASALGRHCIAGCFASVHCEVVARLGPVHARTAGFFSLCFPACLPAQPSGPARAPPAPRGLP